VFLLFLISKRQSNYQVVASIAYLLVSVIEMPLCIEGKIEDPVMTRCLPGSEDKSGGE